MSSLRAAVWQQLHFLWGFIRHPHAVGSVVPSSPYLARAVIAQVPSEARFIAELGPGTGPVTRAILRRARADATVLALEIDPAFCALLRRDLPDQRLRIVNAPAQQLPRQAAELGGSLEAVVSGLPFANFPPAQRREIVGAAYEALAPGGIFTGYGYAPFALPAVLREVFGNCHISLEVRNMPPAFVFSARKSG